MKRYIWGVLALVILSGCGSATVGKTASPSPPPDVAWLYDAALSMATSMKEPQPAMKYALTNRAAANKVMPGAAESSAAPVYVVVLRGDFTYVGARGPLGQPIPTGTTLVWEVDPATHIGVGLWLTHSSSIDTSAIGPLTALTR